VGTQVSQLAFPLLVLALTRSALQAGIVAAIRGIPYVLLILPIGALADRWDRKRIMLLSDAGRAIALGSIPLALALGHLTLVHLAIVSLIEGTLYTFFNVAEASALPHVVPREQLGMAVGQSQATESISTLVGPSLAGFLFGVARGVPFLVDAVSYGASVISLLFVRSRFTGERNPAPLELRREIGEGLRWLWGHEVVRLLALLTGILNLFSFGYPLIVIVRAQQMHASPAVIGLIFATGGIGGFLGSLLVGPLLRRFRVGPVIVAATWLWALTWLPYALAPNPVALAAANAFGWVIVPIFMATQYSYRLAVIPDALQGRVNSVFKLAAFGGQPISLALTGFLLQVVGPVETVILITIPQVILAVFALGNRRLRSAGYLVLAR
jgi:MFS family permease